VRRIKSAQGAIHPASRNLEVSKAMARVPVSTYLGWLIFQARSTILAERRPDFLEHVDDLRKGCQKCNQFGDVHNEFRKRYVLLTSAIASNSAKPLYNAFNKIGNSWFLI
jgi:hypothetical protein